MGDESHSCNPKMIKIFRTFLSIVCYSQAMSYYVLVMMKFILKEFYLKFVTGENNVAFVYPFTLFLSIFHIIPTRFIIEY